MKLREYLESYTVENLKPLAALCEDRPPTRKAELIACIAQQMSSSEGLRRQWQQLDDLSCKALSQAVHSDGGDFDTAAFLARYGKLPSRPESHYSWKRTAVRLDLFLHAGHVPDDLLPQLETWVPRPEPFKLQGQQEVPTAIKVGRYEFVPLLAETEHSGPADLAAFLRLADSGKVQVSTKSHMPTGATLKRVLSILNEGDFLESTEGAKSAETIRPVGLTTFAIGSGLAEVPRSLSNNKLMLTETGRTWLRSLDPKLLLEAFERWVRFDGFDELSRIRAIRGRNAAGTRLIPPSQRRERIIEALSWCPTGVWIDVEDFFRAILIWQFDFDVEATSFPHLYVGYNHDNAWMSATAYWRIMNGLYILTVLWEYLATIGALDVTYLLPEEADYEVDVFAYDEMYYSLYDGLKYFRINDLGAYLLGQHAEYAPLSHTRSPFLQVDPDMVVHITSPEQTTQADILALKAVAVPLAEHRYRIDVDSLLLALEEERDLESALNYLIEWHDGPVPEELPALFADAIARGKAFAAPESAFTVEARDPDLLRVVLEDPNLKRFCQPAGDRTIVVLGKNRERTFRRQLRELGYVLPKA